MPSEAPADGSMQRAFLARNTVLLFAGNLAQALLGLCTGIILARYLGAVGFGQYAFVMTAVSVSGLFVELGFNTFLTRDVARHRSRATRYLAGSLLAKSGLAAATSVPYLLALWWLKERQEDALIAALLAGPALLLVIAFNASFASLFRAFEAMDDLLVLNGFAVAGQLSGMWALAASGYGVAALVWWSVGVQAGRLIVSWRLFRRLLDRHAGARETRADAPEPSWLAWSLFLIKGAWPFGLSTMAITLYARLDILLLFFLAGDQAVGRYSAVYRFLDALRMPPGAFQGAYLPAISRMQGEGRRTDVSRSFKAFRLWLLGYGAVSALVITLLARPLVTGLYTDAFTPSVPVLQVLIWALVPLAANDLTLTYLYADGRERVAPRIMSAGLAINFMLNVWLIPRYGAMGAAVAAVVSDSVLFVIFRQEGNRHDHSV